MHKQTIHQTAKVIAYPHFSAITITIEAKDPYSTHKCIITPSVAVNPPAFQYFKGIQKDFCFASPRKTEEIDERLKEITSFIVIMLSSKDYPNPPICSEKEAISLAQKHVPSLLNKIKHCQKVSAICTIIKMVGKHSNSIKKTGVSTTIKVITVQSIEPGEPGTWDVSRATFEAYPRDYVMALYGLSSEEYSMIKRNFCGLD